MADQDSSALFGLDDGFGVGPSFFNDTPGNSGPRDPADPAAHEADSSLYSSPSWGFPDPTSYDSYGLPPTTTAAAANTSLFQTAGAWDFSPSQQQQLPQQSLPPTTASPDLDQSSLRQAGLYAPPTLSKPAPRTKAGKLPQQQQPPPLSQQQQQQPLAQLTTVPPSNPNLLTLAQQEQLRNIAMPAHLQYHSPKSESSPGSTATEHKGGALHSPDSGKPNSRKRKSSADYDDDDDDEDDAGQPVKKTAHNMIEKRYRTNLNDKIAALRDSVPSLRIMSKSARGEDTTEDREELHGLTPAHKLNKATVLSKATEYIRHLEKRNSRLLNENSAMQARIAAFEKLFMAGAMNGAMSPIHHPPTPMQYPQDAQFLTTPLATPHADQPQGMIAVPDDMKRILSAQMAVGQPYPVPQQPFLANAGLLRQQQIQQQQQQQMQQQGRWGQHGAYFGKLMVGSLAGLMILEAIRENEQSNETPEGRGLFAVPTQLIAFVSSHAHVHIAGHYISSGQLFSYLKVLLFLGTFLWVFVPSLFASPPPKSEKAHQVRGSGALEAAPSLASPITVRRQAWLTAIQTVWVPQHNFLLEAAALVLKTMKLSLRNTIGIHGYQMLTGLTQEQEAARVKAWSIALDAQLAGGDVEINKSRLTLTLLASGTLPDTPLRLMLKALHIRVLLRDFGQSGLHNMFAAKMARSRWNEARQLSRVLDRLRRSGAQLAEEDLPDHLMALLEQECDEVLNDDVIQRAYNLAWNLPTTENVTVTTDGMDGVVDDEAVRSPMDAVAAWWSSLTLHRAMVESLDEPDEEEGKEHEDGETPTRICSQSIKQGILGALRTAPIGSRAQTRALVARSVLVDEKRGAHIASALQAIQPLSAPPPPPPTTNANPIATSAAAPPPAAIVDTASALLQSPDVMLALRCSMAIAHLQRIKSAAPPHEGLRLIETIAVPGAATDLSLLGCTALFKLMEELYANRAAAETFSTSLERLAGGLRMCIGGAAGDKCNLAPEVRRRMVNRCLAITKSVVGFETDAGYGSMSECEEEFGC